VWIEMGAGRPGGSVRRCITRTCCATCGMSIRRPTWPPSGPLATNSGSGAYSSMTGGSMSSSAGSGRGSERNWWRSGRAELQSDSGRSQHGENRHQPPFKVSKGIHPRRCFYRIL